MKKDLLYIAAALMLGTSCTKQDIVSEVSTDNRHDGIELNIGISPVSRTSTDADYKTVFVDGDQIGVFSVYRTGDNKALESNLCYSYAEASGVWSADRNITYPLDGSELNFYSYYPYTETATGLNFDFSVAEDQSVEGAYAKSDLLLASNTSVSVGDENVSLTFAHKLAMVEITVSLPDGENVKSVALRAKRTASVDLKAQTVTLKESADAEYIVCQPSEGKYRVVVPAQSLSGKIIRVEAESGRYFWYKSDTPLTLTAAKVMPIQFSCNGSENAKQ